MSDSESEESYDEDLKKLGLNFLDSPKSFKSKFSGKPILKKLDKRTKLLNLASKENE